MTDHNLDLNKEFDTALSTGDQRVVRNALRRVLAGDAEGKSLADKFNDSSWNLTKGDEVKIIEVLGRLGLSGIVGQRVLSIAAEHDDHNPNRRELEGLQGGLLGASDQAAAGLSAARATAGLSLDQTPNLVNSFVHVDPLTAVSEFDSEDERDGAPDPVKPNNPTFTPT